jgi:uncharacterized protein with PIN domain/ribosomal protein S7
MFSISNKAVANGAVLSHVDRDNHLVGSRVDITTELARLERDKSNLESTLAAREAEVVEGNRRILTVQSALETARREVETLKADYDTEVTHLQRDKSDLQSALGALKREVAEGKQRLSLGIGDFKQWTRESSVNADTLLSDPDPSPSSSEMHHALAHNALLKVRSEIWSPAYEDANRVNLHSLIRVLMFTRPHVKSIIIRPSAMGYIAKALAQIGKGEAKKAMQVFDLAFGNCNPNESNLLLLIKVCNAFIWQVFHTTKRSRSRPSSYSWLTSMTRQSRAFMI